MTSNRTSILAMAAATALCSVQPALAAPADALVVTQLPDPDPNYAPPKAEKKAPPARRGSDEPTTLDGAMENLGRVLGQAAKMVPQHTGPSAEQWQADARERMQKLREQAGLPQQ
jgi:hypothetical protein